MRSGRGRSSLAALAATLALSGCTSGSPGAMDGGEEDRGRDSATPDHDLGPVADGPRPDIPSSDAPPTDGPGPAADGPAGDLTPPPTDAALADIVFVDAAPPPAGCGDGARDPGEECDDGNTTNLDGCSSACRFELVHRIYELNYESGAIPSCPDNAFGSAFHPLVLAQIRSVLDTALADGSMTVLLQFLGLDALDGADDPLLTVGMMDGAPLVGAGYDGMNDLDWWYAPHSAHINGARMPLKQLNAAISGKTLLTARASISFPMNFWPVPTRLALVHARLFADVGAASTPLTSTGSAPGHVAAENLDPAISAFESMGQVAGQICGRIPAAALQAVAILPELASGRVACSEGYSTANNMLDVFVGGCTMIVLPGIQATQPDTEDPGAPPAGAGPAYRLIPNATTKVVDRCRDRSGKTVDITACLADAAYSVYFSFASRRVTAR